ncbi:MAG: urease accessory protein [Rhizobiales bacterium]|nr:urease accessory protein [Hyphomicrobiales bacterium]
MTLRSLAIPPFVAAIAILFPEIAFAHPGTGTAADFVHGFLHPITGIDHILAMVAVGIFAYQIGGRALWLVPAIFILGMVFGGTLGISGVNVPFIELGITLSIIVLGTVVCLGVKAPIAAAMGVVGFFAIFHGHAHGTEIPENISGIAYAMGFVGTTGLLHLGGIGIGFLIGHVCKTHESALVRIAGGLMTVAGIGILAGAI